MLILIYNGGVLFGFVIASFFDYFGQIKINIMLPIIFLAAFNYFPETPEYLLKRNQKIVRELHFLVLHFWYPLLPFLMQLQAAEKSRNFYRGIKNPRSLELKKVVEHDKAYEKIESDSTSLSLSDFCAYFGPFIHFHPFSRTVRFNWNFELSF